MSVITSQQQNILRSSNKQTKLYLSVYQPSTILACRVNDLSIAKGERSITYDSVSSGTWQNVVSGMTLMVGSSAGSDDKGRIRVRSATSSVLTVAENSHINWSDNDYLTVINFFEINAVYPRIIQDPSDETKLIFYKDYDIAYSNQNSILGTFVVMGSHYAGFLDSGSNQVYYSASGTHSLTGEGLNYQWRFEGGTPSTFSGQNPGLVTYNTPGHYTTTLTVSGSTTGAIDSSHRHISIYERPEDGINNPILNWELNDLSGDRNKNGYVGRIKINQIVGTDIIKDGSLIVIFSEDWFNGTKQSIGGNSLNRNSTFLVGYILEGSITYNYRESTVEFDFGSPTEIMKQAEGFSISVSDSVDPAQEAATNPDIPSGWVVLKNMDVRRALFHYLKWQSTVLKCMDVRFIGNDKRIQFFDSDRTSLFDAVNTLMNGALMGSVVSDRQGNLYFETPIWDTVETSNYYTNMEITSRDWMDEPTITERMSPEISFVEMGGIAWSGAFTGTYGAFLSSIPGDAPGYRGSVERRQGLAVSSQSQLNQIGGDYFAFLNMRYPEVLLTLPGAYRNFDITPQEIIPFTVSSSENVRGISFNRKSFSIQSLSYVYDPTSEYLLATTILSELTSGFTGDTIPIPDIPPTGGSEDSGGGGYGFPPIVIPPLPNFNPTVLGVLSRMVITPDYVYDDSAPSTPINFNTTVDGWNFADDGNVYKAEGAFAIPEGANHCIISFVFRLPSGVAAGNAFLTREFAIWTPSTSAVTNTSTVVADDSVAIPSTSAPGRKTAVGDYVLDAGTHFNQGDIVQWVVGRDSSADPPDSYSGDLYFVGILVRFYL